MTTAGFLRRAGRALVPRVLAVLVGLFAGALGYGRELSGPSPEIVGAIPATLPGAEDVRIPSGSGAALHGWWVPAPPGGGTVVLLHGLRLNRLSMVERARRLSEAGFSVLLFDFQAHGESPGRHITLGKLEALDVVAAVTFARGRRPGDRVGVLGSSLGAAAALLTPNPLDVDALVLESVYADIDQGVHSWMGLIFSQAAIPLFEPVIGTLFKYVLLPSLGIAADELRPIDHVAGLTAPVLIANGTKDAITPLADTRRLFERAPQPKLFWAVPGARHVDLERYAGERYWATVLPFLLEWLRPAAPPTAGTLAANLASEAMEP